MATDAARAPEPLKHDVTLPSRPPRCPDYRVAESVEDLMPYFDSVAKRPFSNGLWAAWDLQPGERVLLRVDSWHDPLCVEAAVKTLEKFGCEYELVNAQQPGPPPQFDGHDEAEVMMDITKDLAEWFTEWERLDAEGLYDKVIWGYGGPILSERRIKVQRFPFITPEMVMSAAHTFPAELLVALDKWSWDRMREGRVVRITDPEGTDLTYTSRDEYWDDKREFFNPDYIRQYYPQNMAYGRTYLPGHIWGKPNFYLPEGLEDGHGVVAGTMNHIGPFPWMKLTVEGSSITEIEGGGLFGDKLRKIADQTAGIRYPGMPGKGLLHWWEASIGTNPKIHRPRKDYMRGWNCALFERMRSGIVHIGYGSIISSAPETEATLAGLPNVGHWHIHLNYPTVTLEMADGATETLIEDGRLKGLDDPEIRRIAERYGDPDKLLEEDWIPAVPGINMDGDYWRDYAQDPTAWTMAELNICRNWHHLYMKMISPSGHAHDAGCSH
jgi:hypothetical protein